MLTSALASGSLISVMTLICLSIYWLTGKLFLKSTPPCSGVIWKASDEHLMCGLCVTPQLEIMQNRLSEFTADCFPPLLDMCAVFSSVADSFIAFHFKRKTLRTCCRFQFLSRNHLQFVSVPHLTRGLPSFFGKILKYLEEMFITGERSKVLRSLK